ncbi:hypothetical protein [Anaerovibrio sp.]|uniref:hypothetical protein n=1 Tax=Anaerovibrio sp. TaxID=1872532 RepID=UPI003F148A6F
MAFNWKKMREDFEDMSLADVKGLSPETIYDEYDGPSPEDDMWLDICESEYLPEDMMEKLGDYLNWNIASKTQYMTPGFVLQNLDKINLPALKENPTLDLSRQEWQKLVPYMEPGKGKPYFLAQKDNDEQYITLNVISPKALAEAMAVELVGKGIKAKKVAEKIVDKGKSFLARAREMKMRIKQMPREAVTKVKEQARESYNAVKDKAVQTIQDIANDDYEVKESFVSLKIKKPNLITPKEMATAMCSEMKDVTALVKACSALKDTGMKFLRDISPMRVKSESELKLVR